MGRNRIVIPSFVLYKLVSLSIRIRDVRVTYHNLDSTQFRQHDLDNLYTRQLNPTKKIKSCTLADMFAPLHLNSARWLSPSLNYVVLNYVLSKLWSVTDVGLYAGNFLKIEAYIYIGADFLLNIYICAKYLLEGKCKIKTTVWLFAFCNTVSVVGVNSSPTKR